MTNTSYPLRINKYLAEKGYATRKAADVFIEKGLVQINGRRAILGDKVGAADVVNVRLPRKSYRYFAYNKSVGVITHSPQRGEKDIATASALRGVCPVGRLDKASHGLIVLTDDARITERLLSPRFEHEKEYRVHTKEVLPANFKKRMEAGVFIESYRTKKCRVTTIDPKSFTIMLTEGKKHQIRRMCAAFGIAVTDLQRTRVMNIKLGKLKVGQHRTIDGSELTLFLKALGL